MISDFIGGHNSAMFHVQANRNKELSLLSGTQTEKVFWVCPSYIIRSEIPLKYLMEYYFNDKKESYNKKRANLDWDRKIF